MEKKSEEARYVLQDVMAGRDGPPSRSLQQLADTLLAMLKENKTLQSYHDLSITIILGDHARNDAGIAYRPSTSTQKHFPVELGSVALYVELCGVANTLVNHDPAVQGWLALQDELEKRKQEKAAKKD